MYDSYRRREVIANRLDRYIGYLVIAEYMTTNKAACVLLSSCIRYSYARAAVYIIRVRQLITPHCYSVALLVALYCSRSLPCTLA